MSLKAASTPRFLRRTALNPNEYNTDFLMTDREIAMALTSIEADKVTPLMSKIYLRLKLAPDKYWERDGVLYFCAEDREGKPVKAWTVLCDLTGVASATASKAMQWMHEQGIIGYFSGKNGVGIRIFLNRAAKSIGVRASPAKQKILQFPPASSHAAPASQNEPAFRDSFAVLDVSDPDISPAAGAATNNGILRELPTPTPIPTVDPEELVSQILQAIEPLVSEAVNREGQRTFARIRDWLERFGIPKATRVAVHEGYKVAARADSREEKQRRHEAWINVGRNETAFEEAKRLEDDEVEMYARMCIEFEAKTGQLTETTLAELSAEAGGPILAEDAPRVRALVEKLMESREKSAHESVAVEPRQSREDPEEAYHQYVNQTYQESLRAIAPDEWERLLEAERPLLLAENPSSKVFRGETLRKVLEGKVMQKVRAGLNVKSYEEFISER